MLCNIFVAQTTSAWQIVSKEEIVSSYKNICNWFINTSNYAFDMKYTSYKGHSSSDIIENSNGYYKRSGKKYATEVVGIKTIQNEKARIIIDTNDQVIAISNPSSLSPNIQSSEDLIKLLENVKSLKKKNLGKLTTYRIEFKKNELYEAYEFSVNDKSLLEKLTYYYAEQTEKDYGDDFSKKPSETKMKPRLEIIFSNYQVPAIVKDSDFNDKSIVIASNNKVELLEKYKVYQLKDYRIKEN